MARTREETKELDKKLDDLFKATLDATLDAVKDGQTGAIGHAIKLLSLNKKEIKPGELPKPGDPTGLIPEDEELPNSLLNSGTPSFKRSR